MSTNDKPREVYVNMLILKNEVTPWKENPVGYKSYFVCHSTEAGPFSKNEVLFREVLPTPQITDEEIREASYDYAEKTDETFEYAKDWSEVSGIFESGVRWALERMGNNTKQPLGRKEDSNE